VEKKNKKNIDLLFKTDGTTEIKKTNTLENSNKYTNTKKHMNILCQNLNTQSSKYDPKGTVDLLNRYLKKTDKLDRILYSEISSYIFGLTSDNRGIFLTNVEKLLVYVLNQKKSIKEDTRKIIIKIYDHVQLATHQIENASNIFEYSIEDVKNKLSHEISVIEKEFRNELKSIEKGYITILGIFAAIVLAFVGTITFTTSVLQNIDKASIFRLILTVDVLGLVVVNVIYLLISFILKINDECNSSNNRFIIIANIILFGIAILVLVAWFFNFIDFQKYISKYYPWVS
jgi:hypothetical protein